jgi:hypothetical protein
MVSVHPTLKRCAVEETYPVQLGIAAASSVACMFCCLIQGLTPSNKEMSEVHRVAAGEQTEESLAQLQPEK